MRFFNTAGPVNCRKHYCLPPLERFELSQIESLIAQEKYFVLHAPRQTGKTSSMLALQKYLNAGTEYRCLYVNVEGAQAAREDVQAGIQSILAKIDYRYRNTFKDSYLHERWPGILNQSGAHSALTEVLGLLAGHMQYPLVLILDEIDSLVGDTLIAVLRQLREGYDQRPEDFPQSIMLCGVRDVRDYRIHSSSTKEIITGGSAFNIKAESLRLGDFIQVEVEELLGQHTKETGQTFTPEAKACIWHLTQGQPWLVNALAYETCFRMKEDRDRSLTIKKEMVDQAQENLIARRETHLDQLGDKLQEERVQRVIAPMLEGLDLDVRLDDLQYVLDLGLIRDTSQGPRISNPIYAEIIPRELTVSQQANLEARYDRAWYVRSDGSLDLDKLIFAFQEFFREHSQSWLERFQYKEAGPQLLMQAFLQRVVNSGGRVEREFGLGRMRTDLLVLWPLTEAEPGKPSWTRWQGPVQKVVIELKILYKSLERTIEEGLEQTREYMDRCEAGAGHLIIYDRRENISWEEKIFCLEKECRGQKIVVWGM